LASLTPELLDALKRFKVTASMVVGNNGETVTQAGNSKGLGNGTDLELLKALRRQCEVVLTTGLTYRLEEYKFPGKADLAVLSRSKMIKNPPNGQRFLVLNSGYCEALDDLAAEGYQRIQVEYGLTGIKTLIETGRLDALAVSGLEKDPVAAFCADLGLRPKYFAEEDLVVAIVAWQRT
jgi:riboflavin biosynthesis pyrimidine reductase